MNKYFKEVITHKALGFKLSTSASSKFGDSLIDQSPEFKNVCAPLHKKMIDELEGTIGLLGLSKREFITMAIQNALDEAQEILNEIDAFEYHEEIINENKAMEPES